MQLLPALTRASALALSGVLLAPARVLAADGEGTRVDLGGGETAGQAAEVGATGGSLARTIVGLAIVIGVIFGLTWVLKQVRASRQGAASGAGLETLASLPLGTNRSLHLVRAGEEVVLVGAGEHGVTPIRAYSVAEARALGLLGEPAPAAAAALEPEVFGTEGRRGRFIDELRKRTVI